MTPRVVMLLNDRAGVLKVGPSPSEIETKTRQLGLDAHVVYTQSADHFSREIAKAIASKAEKIVVSGGDGTVHLAVQQLAHSESALGILPMGTANNFATALHLPIELGAALTTIKTGRVSQVSLGQINDCFFTETAGVGIFADALALYGKGTNKNIFKALWAITGLLLTLPRSRLKITLDNKEVVERALMCTVANIFRFGSAYPIAPEASLTDDQLDVVIVGDVARHELPTYYRAMKAQNLKSLPKVQTAKSRAVKIEALKSLNVHCDDQVITTTPVSISVVPRALKVITPKL